MTALDLDGAGPVRRHRGPLAVVLALGACALAGCLDEREPSWVGLTRAFEPRALTEVIAGWERATPGPSGTRVVPQDIGLGLELEVAEWEPAETPGCFDLALPGGAWRACGLRPRLVGRGREYPRAPADRAPEPGEVSTETGRLVLRLPAEISPVPPSVLALGADGAAGEQAIPSSAWRVESAPGTFSLALPAGVAAADGARLFAQLVRVDEARALAPFEYRVESRGKGRSLTLCWPGEGRPPAMRLAVRLENGRHDEGRWELRSGRFCGTGIPVWSGGREELALDVPPASELSFRFVHGGETEAGAVAIRVWLDGELLGERSFPGGAREPEFVSLALPARGKPGARLAFEVEGVPGLGAFFAPAIAPLARGRPGARPWAERPDIVLFLVDTLRADALAEGGGEATLAPNLNRFAASSLRFPAARANAAWTLPSISSLLTGFHPGQHGATDEDLSLPGFHRTIAERLAAAGYRTGAITDGSFFSPIFGLEQGFEWFTQREWPDWDLDLTLADAREFLERDDGRPVFLVVHTYRVHQPYRVGPDEDPSAYDALLEKARVTAGVHSPTAAAGFRLAAQYAGELRALYQEGVRDLDRGFGAFLDELEARDFFAHGFLALTSDHGEALGENGEFFHGRTLWDVKLRVPLCVRGPGLAPRALPYAAGPVDLTPTFAELAGLPADPGWVGTSLLGLARDRASFAFQLGKKSREVALLEGTRKVMLPPELPRLASGRCEHAFELAEDPREEHDLVGTADWPAELTRRLAPALLGYLEPRGSAESAGISPELEEQLKALGYGGEDAPPAPEPPSAPEPKQ